MADERFEVPKEMRAMAEANFDQARKAFESFLGSAQQAASSLTGTTETARANAKDIGARAVAFAEKNVQASPAHAASSMPANTSGTPGSAGRMTPANPPRMSSTATT